MQKNFKPGEKAFLLDINEEKGDSGPISIKQVKIEQVANVLGVKENFVQVVCVPLNKEEAEEKIKREVENRVKVPDLPGNLGEQLREAFLEHVAENSKSGWKVAEELVFRAKEEIEEYFASVVHKAFPLAIKPPAKKKVKK